MYINIMSQLAFILPEVFLTIGGIALLMFGAYSKTHCFRNVTILSIVILTIALYLNITNQNYGIAFGDALIINGFTKFLITLVILGTAFSVLLSYNYAIQENFANFELPILYIFTSVGMLVMIKSCNLLSLYLGIELQSLPLYALACFQRDNYKSSEAGIKYFILGSLSSGMLLYGASLIYGFTGHIDYGNIAVILASKPYTAGIVFGMVFVLSAIAFKIAAVPFHMWSPDVYEGSPTPITAFFAGAPKIAALGLLVNIIVYVFSHMPNLHDVLPAWKQIIVFISILSMVLGSFAAIAQKNIKRLMAYSSIGHVGYVLVALLSGTISGIAAMLIYLSIYLVTIIGVFAIILSLRNTNGKKIENIQDLAGLSKDNMFIAVAMTSMMFSLAGIPPLAGFFAKWYSFVSAVNAGFVWVAVIGVLTSVVGAYYYLRIIKIIWFDSAKLEFAKPNMDLKLIIVLALVLLISYIIFAGHFYQIAFDAANSIIQ